MMPLAVFINSLFGTGIGKRIIGEKLRGILSSVFMNHVMNEWVIKILSHKDNRFCRIFEKNFLKIPHNIVLELSSIYQLSCFFTLPSRYYAHSP